MKPLSIFGCLLIAAGIIAAWAAALGIFMPSLDAYATFMPLYAVPILLGAVLAWPSRPWPLIAAAIALLPIAGTVAPELLRTIPSAPRGAPQVRIVTHNVWKRNLDPAQTAQTILDAHPDIVLLQEASGNFRPMLAALRQHFPYSTDCPTRCDLAIFSRWPIGARDYHFRDAEGRSFGPPLVWARITPPGMAPFTVATLHYGHPSPPGPQARMRWELAAAVRRIDPASLVVAGDMNLTPWASAMREQDKALSPLTRMTRALASWRRSVPLLPIDHLYAGPGWGLVEARRLSATGSDHYPLLVTLGRR
ncbi:endonuclease/exonuclease/phosphatase family protein [Sphingomonas sp. JC676]|uniref:endonuclease/exonuclease/phosphatase family protein n=1 Tax=Sphingomonas sp. JC676 TaxID=2768065 RepID=UPI00165845C1|nr:endonuclease/exonuclease/phosphatase family protein [Sphingomonas sp. JC676]MBC9031011.1 endonuclease/exonuclease/phosphatase family protein [Sphingomonas sp. JC676]